MRATMASVESDSDRQKLRPDLILILDVADTSGILDVADALGVGRTCGSATVAAELSVLGSLTW
jgi:hypothetical protein